MNEKLATIVAFVQGAYFLLTGVWPIVSIETFQMVTGRKTDLWLVKTVGLLVGVIGAVLLWAGWSGEIMAQTVAIAIGSALALTAIDVYYVARRVIAPIYLADALAELVLVAIWIAALTLC
jgi:hypothetical protein